MNKPLRLPRDLTREERRLARETKRLYAAIWEVSISSVELHWRSGSGKELGLVEIRTTEKRLMDAMMRRRYVDGLRALRGAAIRELGRRFKRALDELARLGLVDRAGVDKHLEGWENHRKAGRVR